MAQTHHPDHEARATLRVTMEFNIEVGAEFTTRGELGKALDSPTVRGYLCTAIERGLSRNLETQEAGWIDDDRYLTLGDADGVVDNLEIHVEEGTGRRQCQVCNLRPAEYYCEATDASAATVRCAECAATTAGGLHPLTDTTGTTEGEKGS